MESKTYISRIKGPDSALSNYERQLKSETAILLTSLNRKNKWWSLFFGSNTSKK